MQNLELSIARLELVLEVQTFHVEEAMSRPFDIELSVKSNLSLDLAAIIGQTATLTAEPSPTNRAGSTVTEAISRLGERGAQWTGIVASIEEFGSEQKGLSLYRVHLVHPLWVLSQNRNYRIFRRSSELDIARALMSEWSLKDSPRVDLERYKKRDYRIQYGESDLDFLHRNLEDVGVSYYLEESQAGGELITLSPEAPR